MASAVLFDALQPIENRLYSAISEGTNPLHTMVKEIYRIWYAALDEFYSDANFI